MRGPGGSDQESWWSLTCEMLDRFLASSPDSVPNALPTRRYDAWVERQVAAEELLGQVEPPLAAPPPALSGALRALVLRDEDPGDAAHAMAWLLDERYARTFPDDWIAAADGPIVLADGDAYPLTASPWAIFKPFLSQPASLTDPGLDELPHVRRHRPTTKQRDKVRAVEVHPAHTLLRDALVPLTDIATGHPNVGWGELTWAPGRRIWPVTVVDEERQDARLHRIVTEALAAGCGLIVLPELSATGQTAAMVQALLDDHYEEHEEAVLVVAGSQHVETPDGARRNRAQTLVAGGSTPLTHDKIARFRTGKAIEDLSAGPTLRLYQDGPFRFATAICKDVLDADVRGLLGDLGVNVLAVPAMSDETANFSLALGELLGAAQTVSVVANGPLRTMEGEPLARCSLAARPTADGDAVRTWAAPPAPPADHPTWVSHPLIGGAPTAMSLTGH